MEKDNDHENTASFSPSFSTYSGDRIAEIAERVGQMSVQDNEDEFEFAILHQSDRDESVSSSTDGGFLFPVFNQNLVSEISAVKPLGEEVITPLKDLFLREDHPPQQTYSSSSDDDDEIDELDTIPNEIYCPWTPARSTAEMSPSGGCRKSKSTGSSSTSSWSTKRWRIRDLLKRSHSDGKQSLKFLNPNSVEKNYGDESSSKKKTKEKKVSSAHEKFYLRNKAMKEEEKRKSYLPYKKDLVGLFINRY